MSRALLIAVALLGCDETAADADAAPERVRELDMRAPPTPDAAPENLPDADPCADAGTDAADPPDAEPDLGAAPDAGPDAQSDAPMDAGSADGADATAPDAQGPDAGPAAVYVGDAPIYQPGPLAVREVAVEEGQAAVPLTLFVPEGDGPFAVVVYQHGFLLSSRYSAGRLRHLASHGFVVAAPQMYPADGNPIGKPTAAEEAAVAGRLVDWLEDNLARLAEVSIAPAVGLAGHSRGGKVAWLLLREDPQRAQAIAGIDPVDGMGGRLGGQPRLIDGPFDLPQPALVIGTGLGPTGFTPCAPEGDNHEQFYDASPGPAWHVVGPDHGHNDVLDANIMNCLPCILCPAGPTPDDFGRAVVGQQVAFFRATLQGDATAFDLLVADGAPARLTVESK